MSFAGEAEGGGVHPGSGSTHSDQLGDAGAKRLADAV